MKVRGTRKIRKPSSYMKFCKSVRSKVISENPGIKFGAVGKEMGKRWRELSASEKAGFK